MLSRVADSIYWINRYVERAENVARFIDVNLNLILDAPSPGMTQQWDPILAATGDLNLFLERYGMASAETTIHFLAFDPNYPNSILNCLHKARENARSVREIISSEMWEQLNSFYLLVKQGTQQFSLPDVSALFSEIKLASHLFAGVMDATMSHSEGWHFGQMGRLLERADKTSRILDVKYFILLPSPQDVGSVLDDLQWIALLKSTSAYEMYRKKSRHHRISPTGVAEFLILDREFPRSIMFCLMQADHSLRQITGTPSGTWRDPVERSLGRLQSELGYLTIDEIIHQGLHEFLNDLQLQLNRIDDKMFATFFSQSTSTVP